MRYRLFLAIIAVVMLVSEPSFADPVLRYRARGNQPAAPPYRSYDYIYGQAPLDGFLVGPNEWWIGNEPYLPYYGYNPPTVNGYYPPYAMPYYYGSGYYDGGGYPILPAPPLVTPPVVVPPIIARPVSPAVISIRRAPGGGWIISRDPHFQLLYVPPYPDYLTAGSAYYPTPTYPVRPRGRF